MLSSFASYIASYSSQPAAGGQNLLAFVFKLHPCFCNRRGFPNLEPSEGMHPTVVSLTCRLHVPLLGREGLPKITPAEEPLAQLVKGSTAIATPL